MAHNHVSDTWERGDPYEQYVGRRSRRVAPLFPSWYWQPFMGGQGPAPAYAMSLDETARARLREKVRALIPMEAGGAISLTARAWAARATVAK